MKKIVIRKKKASTLQRAAILGMAILMSAGTITVQAKESAGEGLTTQVYVYHEHKGDSENGGGCFSVPVYHVHEGSEAEGGKCYQTPVYHVHEGDEQAGGPCYGKAVYHTHDGNNKEGGLCYKVVYHSHSEECYEMIPSGTLGCTVLQVEETDYDDYVDHDFKDYYMSCGMKVHGTNPAHYHEKLTCDREGKVDSFKLTCKMTSSTIERYEMDCTKTEETIDSYQLSCPKTETDIDQYEMGCGRDESTPLGKITVTGKLTSSKKKANITAVYEDMSEGEIVISENAFAWYNEKGKLLGNGEKLQVTANGTYYVILDVQNEDVKTESLKAEVTISGIQKKKTETGKGDTGDDSGKGDSSDDNGSGGGTVGGDDGGSGGGTGGGGNDSGNAGGSGSTTPVPTSTATPSPSPTAAPIATIAPTPEATATATASPEQKHVLMQDTDAGNLQKRTPGGTPSPAPLVKKETKKVELEEKESNKEDAVLVETMEKQDDGTNKGFLATPAAKIMTVTAGTLGLVAGAGLLLFLLGRSIRVYNDDGKGNLIYLGRGIVKVEEEGYVIVISERMTEKSLTNRYCLRCDFFHLWKDKEEELIVVKGERRQIVKIQKEMIAVV